LIPIHRPFLSEAVNHNQLLMPTLLWVRTLMVRFRGSVLTSDAGLLAYRKPDDALGLSAIAEEALADARTSNSGRHALVGMLRQSVFGRLAGYEDRNGAERLGQDSAIRWLIDGKPSLRCASSPTSRAALRRSAGDKSPSALADLSGQWIDRVHARRQPRGVLLDMDSSVSPTHGELRNNGIAVFVVPVEDMAQIQ
jgi:hypothetical protein